MSDDQQDEQENTSVIGHMAWCAYVDRDEGKACDCPHDDACDHGIPTGFTCRICITEKARAEGERAATERMQPIVDDYLRQAKNHERHRDAGGILNLAEQTMVNIAARYREGRA